MNNRVPDLLQRKSTISQQEFVKEALVILESDFRKMVLSMLGELVSSNIHLKSIYPEIAALQRPSWGCWNGLLLSLLRARRNVMNSGTLAERESIGKCPGLSAAAGEMEQSVEIDDDKFFGILEKSGYMSASQKRASNLKARELFSIPIFFRNRIAHDNIQDDKWWEDAAHILSYILQWYAASPFDRYNSTVTANEPWLQEEFGEFWCYNGVSTNNGENVVHYVSLSGKNKVDTDRAGRIILGFKKILGEEELQEANFNRLLNKLAPEELKGFILGGYMVGEKAGEGGFADVYKGVQLSTGRRVAIKVLKTGLSDSDKLRFLHEAEYLSMFDHPNIARIYEYNEQPWRKSQLYDLSEEKWFQDFSKSHGSILTFIAMEWIEGKTLDDIYKDLHDNKKSLTEKEIARWFCDAAGALELIHNANLIHRDITPKNIMVTENGIVKLMDFGISRAQYENRTVVTSHGKMLGSEPYMSPEQLDYERAKNELGPRSDIYSLGGTFYELFTRARLYNHNNDAISIATASAQKMRGERPANPGAVNGSISWEISTILMGCLENEPGDRYQTARQLKEDILRFLEDMPIEYKKPGLMRRMRLMYKRNRRIVRLTAAFVLLVTVMTAVYINSLISERIKVENTNKQLTLLNSKLTDQIALTEQQRNLAATNEAEAKKQQKTAEDNAKLAEQNENTALKNMLEAQKQKALAQSNENLALANEAKATASMLLAEKNEKEANEQRDTALENQSRYLAGISSQTLTSGDRTLAIRLALAGLPSNIGNPDRPFVPEAMSALSEALIDTRPARSILRLDTPAQSVAVSSNGKYITTKSSSNYDAIRVWELSSGKEAETFKDLRSSWSNSCVSDDGNTIAVIDPLGYYNDSGDNNSYVAKIYDVNTGRLINAVGFYGGYNNCSLSPRGSVLILINSDGATRTLLNVKSGRTLAKAMAEDIVFSPDEEYALEYKQYVSPYYSINLYDTGSDLSDMSSWKSKGMHLIPARPVDIAFNNNSRRMAVYMKNGDWSALVYNTKDYSMAAKLEFSEDDAISSMALSKDAKYLAVGFWSGTTVIYNVDTGMKIREVLHDGPTYYDPSEEPSDTANVSSIAFSGDAGYFFTSSYAGNVKMWDTETGKNLNTYNHEGFVLQAVLTPDRKKLVSISRDKTVRVWNIEPENIARVSVGNSRYYGFDGTNMIMNCLENGLNTGKYRAYNINNGSIKNIVPGIISEKDYHGFGLSKKPQIRQNTVTIPDWNTGTAKAEFNIGRDVLDASLSADDSLMAVSSYAQSGNTIIDLYSAKSRRKLHSWEVQRNRRVDVNFTPDGKKLVVCKINDYKTWDIYVFDTSDYTQKVYNMGGSYPNYMIGRDSRTIYAVETPDDRVVIREATTGREIVTVKNDYGWTGAYVYFNNTGDMAIIDTGRQEGAGASSAGRFIYECFDLKTGKSLFKTEGTDHIGHVAFSSDRNFVAINTEGVKEYALWDVKSGTRTDIIAEGYPADVTFTPDGRSLILPEFGDGNTYINILKLYNSENALRHAKEMLKDTELTKEEKIQYFVSVTGTETERAANIPDRTNALDKKLAALVGTYRGEYTQGDGNKKVVMEIYKTGADTAEADVTISDVKGRTECEYLAKVHPDTLSDKIFINYYKIISPKNGGEFPDFQGALKNGVISGQTLSLGETSGTFIVSSRGNAVLNPAATSSPGRTAQPGISSADVFSENGLYNSYVWKQGSRIYYSDDQGIYSSNLDGKEEKKLCADDPTSMVLSGEWIYFTTSQCVYKIKTDGSFRQKISDNFARELYIDGDQIYYTNCDDGNKGYKMKTDGSESRLFINHVTWDMKVSGDNIYFRNGDDGYSLYRVKKDGSGLTKLNNINSCNLNVGADRIAFYGLDADNNAILCSMNKDGSNMKMLGEKTHFVNVSGDWIYYEDEKDGRKPYRIRFDGSGRMKLSNDTVQLYLSICGDWVYYYVRSKDDKLDLYRVRADGSVMQFEKICS
ncbi:MAG TPA: DUF5050 domain-containing protein [Clostridia bacterium]|nr:DUF5050 domain-containing protein [Clostridia bacterium]